MDLLVYERSATVRELPKHKKEKNEKIVLTNFTD